VSDAFAGGAVRLAGLVPRLLGWTPGQFWSATPAELAAILGPNEAGGERSLSRAELDHMLERESHG
jgi:uncharacterized phage protein (TIGR02216 family)